MPAPGLTDPYTEAELQDLMRFATAREAKYLEIIITAGHGVVREAARKSGNPPSTLLSALKRVKERAALQGHSPRHGMIHEAPEPFMVKGVSTYHRATETHPAQWVKTDRDAHKLAALREEAMAAFSEGLPRAEPVPGPALSGAAGDLLTVYTITDWHLGMLSWKDETGSSWDLEIAETALLRMMRDLIDRAPAAGSAVLAQLGDFLHADGLVPVTPSSGNVLDADSRYAKVVRTAIRVLRRCIAALLERHDSVHVIAAEGNHDTSGSVWLREMLRAHYEDEPRVTIDTSATPFYVREHGKTLLAWHHGHLVKPQDMPLQVAAQAPASWGRTVYRYAHLGHRHHREEKDRPGMVTVQHTTMAARDAYAARHGYWATRHARAITYHREYGEVATTITNPALLGMS